jgi:hypothetical protein
VLAGRLDVVVDVAVEAIPTIAGMASTAPT